MDPFDQKQAIIQNLLTRTDCQALVLNRISSYAWATDGAASYVNTAASDGAASLLITPSMRYVITTNIEATRMEQEEKLVEQGWKLHASPWWSGGNAIDELAGGLRLAADTPYPGAMDLGAEIAHLRTNLTPAEGERFRRLGRLCAEAMEEAIHTVRPGQSEFQIASQLSLAAEKRGVQAIVNLIATDERIFKFRHPLPTAKKLERYAMLVLCGRKWGLVCSMTRLVHFGKLPQALRDKMQAVAQVDATMIQATRPGVTLARIFESTVNAYAMAGFSDEWKLHHQGGPAAYEPREYIATPTSSEVVQIGQAYAWNPSITGAKSEDTILVGEDGNLTLTTIPGWPEISIEIDAQVITRPAILEAEL
jgi:Xaa-Pro aminopeptidase